PSCLFRILRLRNPTRTNPKTKRTADATRDRDPRPAIPHVNRIQGRNPVRASETQANTATRQTRRTLEIRAAVPTILLAPRKAIARVQNPINRLILAKIRSVRGTLIPEQETA